MGWIWTGILGISIFCAVLTGRGGALAAAIAQGAGAGVELAFTMAGALCLWSGVGRLLSGAGVTQTLSRLLRPLLRRLFPESGRDDALAEELSANFCANFLGLGNAATPMGISAARRLTRGKTATDSLCRLVVLNTASVQLIPATVAALRTGLGCRTPFDILPAVWITSLCSVGAGLLGAKLLERLGKP